MQIFNTLTRQKEEFVPQVPGEYRIYVCGPTVYNYIHIGNARPLIVFDTLRRYLEYRGNKVIYVSNITDIDDKLIKKGQEEGTSMKEVAQRFEAEYLKDAEGLNCKKPTVQPRATEHIQQILDIVKDLIDSGHAYVAKNGDVYFRVKSDPSYGKLSHLKLDDLESGNRELRSQMDDDLKEDPADFAVVLAAAFALSTNAIVALMQVPAAAAAPARQYLFICACGLVFITGYNMVSGVLRGLGDSKRPMYFVLVACIINIVGDLLLVGVFGLGAAGAALATVAAQGVSLALALAVLRRRDFPFDFKRRSFRIQGDKAARILRLGLPVAVQNVLVTLSFLIITAIVNHMDVLAQSAAVGLVERITGFIMLFPIAFQSAISAMTAQNMGAGRPDRARQGLKYGILFCLAADIAMFVLVQLVPGLAMRLFTPDAEVIYHGVLYLRTYSIDCILVTLVFTLNGFYSGCGRTGFTLFNSLASTFLVRVPAVFFISLLPGVTLLHIGVAAPAASAVQVLLQLLYFRTGRWNHSVLGEAQT